MDCLKDDFQAFGATDGSTVDNRLTFGVGRAVWILAAKMDDGAPWHKASANPAVNTPRPSRGTRIESCDFIVLIGDP